MVVENPLMDRREFLRAVDPIWGRGEDELARLQADQVVSAGIVWRETASSRRRAAGRLFCSLNRDAVTAVRQGHADAARGIGQHARRIENETLRPWLDATSDASAEPDAGDIVEPDRSGTHWIDRVVPRHSGDSRSLPEPLWKAANEIADVRARFGDAIGAVRLTPAHVWRIDETFAEVRPEDSLLDEPFAFFSDELLAAGLRLGDPVVVRHEQLVPGHFLTSIQRGLERPARVDRVSGQPQPRHLEGLLDSAALRPRVRQRGSLRRVA